MYTHLITDSKYVKQNLTGMKGETGKFIITDRDFNTSSLVIDKTIEQIRKTREENSLAVQWLGLCTSIAGCMGSIPGQGTKIPQASPCGQKRKIKTREDLNANQLGLTDIYRTLFSTTAEYKFFSGARETFTKTEIT